MRRTRQQLVTQLKEKNLVFSEFTLSQEGNYSVSDADWNYKDVPHLNCVHELVEAVIGVVENEHVATINLQKIMGFMMPITLFNYQSTPTSQTYFTTILFFTLIIESTYEALGPNRSRINTVYSIGSRRWMSWCFPFIKWVLKKNYKNLMSQDVPMRTRRGQLRDWGYSFRRTNPLYGFEDTMDISKSNVIFPENQTSAPKKIEVNMSKDLPSGKEFMVGRDDHFGLRLKRIENEVMAYPRLCPHEGASLDLEPCEKNKVKCHWHGRLFNPILTMNLTKNEHQKFELNYHTLQLDGNILTVFFKTKSMAQ